MTAVGVFVSPHGMGHAARAAAVMDDLAERLPGGVTFELFTQVPERFFTASCRAPIRYHRMETDVGLVQTTPFDEDLPATVAKLAAFLPFDAAAISRLAATLHGADCRFVLCDIAPMGILAARAAGLPSILIENFTWDWIYDGYAPHTAGLAESARYLAPIFAMADVHIQTQPVCRPVAADLTVPVVSRRPRRSRADVRRALGIAEDAPVLLLSLGGLAARSPLLERLARLEHCTTVTTQAVPDVVRRGRLIVVPCDADHYHPDLVHAADAVVAKIGYSTLAEVYHAGLPFGCITRARSPESPPLEAFIRREMQGLPIGAAALAGGAWIDRLPELFALPRMRRETENGAAAAGRFIVERQRD